jgi:hypothetical protein
VLTYQQPGSLRLRRWKLAKLGGFPAEKGVEEQAARRLRTDEGDPESLDEGSGATPSLRSLLLGDAGERRSQPPAFMERGRGT